MSELIFTDFGRFFGSCFGRIVDRFFGRFVGRIFGQRQTLRYLAKQGAADCKRFANPADPIC